jgi:hypothetical protein
MTKRNVIVRLLGNDLASDKNWMIKHLLNLMNVNKLNKKINLFEAKLYKVDVLYLQSYFFSIFKIFCMLRIQLFYILRIQLFNIQRIQLF